MDNHEELIRQAVEGSMEKRQALLDRVDNDQDNYIQPVKTWKCKIGLHDWMPVHQSHGMSICYRCNLLDDGFVKRVARVTKDGCVL